MSQHLASFTFLTRDHPIFPCFLSTSMALPSRTQGLCRDQTLIFYKCLWVSPPRAMPLFSSSSLCFYLNTRRPRKTESTDWHVEKFMVPHLSLLHMLTNSFWSLVWFQTYGHFASVPPCPSLIVLWFLSVTLNSCLSLQLHTQRVPFISRWNEENRVYFLLLLIIYE